MKSARPANATLGRISPLCYFFFQAEDGIRDLTVTGVQTCALPISASEVHRRPEAVGDSFLFLEIFLAHVERRELGAGQSRDGRARARGSAARPGIPDRKSVV